MRIILNIDEVGVIIKEYFISQGLSVKNVLILESKKNREFEAFSIVYFTTEKKNT